MSNNRVFAAVTLIAVLFTMFNTISVWLLVAEIKQQLPLLCSADSEWTGD